MKSLGELWTTTKGSIGAITVVPSREAGGGICVLDEGMYLGCKEGAAPSLLPGTGEVGSFWSPGLVFEEACKVQKHLPTLCSTSLDRDLLPPCRGAAERKPWGSTTLPTVHPNNCPPAQRPLRGVTHQKSLVWVSPRRVMIQFKVRSPFPWTRS